MVATIGGRWSTLISLIAGCAALLLAVQHVAEGQSPVAVSRSSLTIEEIRKFLSIDDGTATAKERRQEFINGGHRRIDDTARIVIKAGGRTIEWTGAQFKQQAYVGYIGTILITIKTVVHTGEDFS